MRRKTEIIIVIVSMEFFLGEFGMLSRRAGFSATAELSCYSTHILLLL